MPIQLKKQHKLETLKKRSFHTEQRKATMSNQFSYEYVEIFS